MGALDGRCLCGAVTYTCGADPLGTFLCHCRDCQRQSGAATSILVVVPSASFEMQGETLAMWETTGTDTDIARERWFCSRCGSPIITRAHEIDGVTIIKAGTLDDVSQLRPNGELWCESAHPWFPELEGTTRFARGLPAS